MPAGARSLRYRRALPAPARSCAAEHARRSSRRCSPRSRPPALPASRTGRPAEALRPRRPPGARRQRGYGHRPRALRPRSRGSARSARRCLPAATRPARVPEAGRRRRASGRRARAGRAGQARLHPASSTDLLAVEVDATEERRAPRPHLRLAGFPDTKTLKGVRLRRPPQPRPAA